MLLSTSHEFLIQALSLIRTCSHVRLHPCTQDRMCPLNTVEMFPLTKMHKMPQNAECTYISFTYAEMFE